MARDQGLYAHRVAERYVVVAQLAIHVCARSGGQGHFGCAVSLRGAAVIAPEHEPLMPTAAKAKPAATTNGLMCRL